jgi:DNA-binding NtrC family response regulator
MSRVLIIDDEPALCWSLAEALRQAGHTVQTAGSVEQSKQRFAGFEAEVIAVDVRLPGVDGLTALSEWRRERPDIPVIVMTAFGDLPTAARAFADGAFEYLVKPFDLNAFTEVIIRALQREPLATAESFSSSDSELTGRSAAMQAVYRQLALVAPTPFPVLLLGETGTGKELAARAIHRHSRVASGPWITVCPAALNPTLIESELFGHVRGAFTGAQEARTGLFEAAAGGTLFLDEIADTPLAVQVKLLRVLETRCFSPVGSGEERTTSARFLAATHRNLPQMIAAGTFREDLYHRLSAFTVQLPPLRDRLEDLPLLVERLIGLAGETLRPAGVSPDLITALAQRPWAGNVRELRNAVDHALVMARGRMLRAEHLPALISAATSNADQKLSEAISLWVRSQLDAGPEHLPEGLYAIMHQHLDAALLPAVLRLTQQNRTAASRILGLDRATLRNRLKGISETETQSDED